MRSPAPTGRTASLVALAAAIVIGGVSFTQIKVALEELSPFALAAGRVTFSALAFVAVVTAQPWRRTPVARADRWRVLAAGLGGSAGFHVLYSWGQQRVSVGVAAVVLGCMPVVVAAGEVVFLRHRLTARQVVGIALSVLGVTLMSWSSSGAAGFSVAGFLAVVGATVAWSAVSVVTRSLGDRYDPWWLNTPGTVVGAVVALSLAAPALGEFRTLSPTGWATVAWLGVAGSAFLYAAMALALRHLTATTTASVSTLVTPIGVLVAWLVLGDVPGAAVVAGGLVVVAGVLLVTSTGRPEPAVPGASTA